MTDKINDDFKRPLSVKYRQETLEQEKMFQTVYF